MERYTITVVPSSGRRMRAFSLSRRRLYLAVISLVSVVMLSLVLGSLATWRFFRRQTQMTTDAVQKYEALNEELRDIRQSYWDLKSILGIETTEPTDEPGRGGPEMPELTDSPEGDLPSLDEVSGDVAMELKPVLMETASLEHDFDALVMAARDRIDDLRMIPSIWPIEVALGTRPWVSSRFGRRRSPFTGTWEMHEAIDIAAPLDTPLIATADGTIKAVSKDRFLGNYIDIRHNERFSTRYGHLNKFAEGIEVGTKVKRGQVIGYMGRTGRSTGCHVHYEVMVHGRRVNPADYILN
jgi:murein DD-endopeptidase MepM/ murein hydrolase activator NlpD